MADGKVTISTALDNRQIRKDWAETQKVSQSESAKIGADIERNIGGGLKKAVSNITKTITAVFAATTAVIGKFTSDAADYYANYEQLVGGVETLFKGASQKVTQYANEAYKTAGMSANEYTETVTGFSASLIQSMGGDTAKAADIANMALVDMADNANKMGSEMESIKTAYQGFAKGQYQLLDNLKLGYGGSKTEMERLLKDAQKLTGVEYDINNLADVYNAIHAIQEELGIAGTTAKEAEKTISGSAASMKAAWKNLLTYLSVGGKDLDKAIDNFVNSFDVYMDNLMPVVERALVGMGEAAARVVPELVEELASAIVQAIPSLVSAVWNSLAGVVKGLFKGLTTLITGGSVEIIGGQTDAIDASVDSQNALTGAVKETNKELERSLAGFDEITKLNSNDSDEESSSGGGLSIETGGGGLSGLEESSSIISKAWDNIAEKGKEFYYEVLGELDVQNWANLSTSFVNLKSGWENFTDAFFSKNGEGSCADVVAGLMDILALTTAGFNKTVGGGLDFLAEYKRFVDETGNQSLVSALLDDEDVWDAMGETIAGIGMTVTPFYWGDMREAMEQLFLADTGEYTNMFRDLSVEAAEALAAVNKAFEDLNRDVRELDWSDAVITKEDVGDIDSQMEAVTEWATARNEQTLEDAKAHVHDLLEQGLISEEEADAAIKKLEGTYDYQNRLLEANRTRVNQILKKAADENRDLYEDELAEIEQWIQSSQDNTVATITQGASDSTDVYEMLAENRGNITKQMLSETIQYANDECDARVQAANDTYEASIASADKLYKELGMIDEEEYKRICQAAEDKHSAQVDAAKTAREELVAEAQAASGEIAAAVDPETGEILSNFEQLWNSCYTTVHDTWEDIKRVFKDAINEIIGFINSPLDTINGWAEKIGGKEIMGYSMPKISLPTVPKLAQGAVLPANKPFLAMVGDQKHGTNVEAPLETIQEAVALVMGDMAQSNAVGHEATVAALERLIEAVLAIRVGDDTIGRAARRYETKMSIIRGGL